MTAKEEPTMASSLVDFMAEFAVVRETAIGYREQLERDGWSPAAAEMVAANWLIEMQRKVMSI